MYLINWFARHWIICIAAYTLVLGWPAILLARTIAEERWYKKITKNLLLRLTLGLVRYAVCYVLVIPGILLALYRIHQDKKEKKRREWEEKIQRRKTAEAYQQRETKRKDWLSCNEVVLYYNTVSGITAVLLPKVFEKTRKETEYARMDEHWEHGILMPAYDTFLFVTETGYKVVKENSDRSGYQTDGWRSELHKFCQANNCKLVHDETIFVPWVNETIVSFEKQRESLRKCQSWNYETLRTELIMRQIPF